MTARLIATKFPEQGCMDDFITERNLDLQAMWVIDALDLCFSHVIHECLYNQALTDVRSTCAGNICTTFGSKGLTRLGNLSGVIPL